MLCIWSAACSFWPCVISSKSSTAFSSCFIASVEVGVLQRTVGVGYRAPLFGRRALRSAGTRGPAPWPWRTPRPARSASSEHRPSRRWPRAPSCGRASGRSSSDRRASSSWSSTTRNSSRSAISGGNASIAAACCWIAASAAWHGSSAVALVDLLVDLRPDLLPGKGLDEPDGQADHRRPGEHARIRRRPGQRELLPEVHLSPPPASHRRRQAC